MRRPSVIGRLFARLRGAASDRPAVGAATAIRKFRLGAFGELALAGDLATCNADGLPVLRGDGRLDDTAALKALVSGEPVSVGGEGIAIREGVVRVTNVRFAVSAPITKRDAHPSLRFVFRQSCLRLLPQFIGDLAPGALPVAFFPGLTAVFGPAIRTKVSMIPVDATEVPFAESRVVTGPARSSVFSKRIEA